MNLSHATKNCIYISKVLISPRQQPCSRFQSGVNHRHDRWQVEFFSGNSLLPFSSVLRDRQVLPRDYGSCWTPVASCGARPKPWSHGFCMTMCLGRPWTRRDTLQTEILRKGSERRAFRHSFKECLHVSFFDAVAATVLSRQQPNNKQVFQLHTTTLPHWILLSRVEQGFKMQIATNACLVGTGIAFACLSVLFLVHFGQVVWLDLGKIIAMCLPVWLACRRALANAPYGDDFYHFGIFGLCSQ